MAKRKKPSRDTELSKDEKIQEQLLKLHTRVEKGFEDQRDRVDQILCNWDMYHCILGEKQFYNGNARIYVPFVRDAIDARVTRFSNQLFPVSGRFVEVTTGEADQPQAQQSLLEDYVRRGKVRTEVVNPLLRNGDVEGQYSIYVSWQETKRHVVNRSVEMPKTDGLDNEAAEPVESISEETIVDARPSVEVIADPDLSIIPATANSVPEALAEGGAVTILRRWSEARIRKAIDDEDIDEEAGEDLIKAMDEASKGTEDKPSLAKQQLDVAGIKAKGKFAVIYETWTILKAGKERYLCRAYYGGEKKVLGCKRNPYWHDRCPVITAAAIKVENSIKGRAKAETVEDLQVLANDTINQGADTANFSAMPIVMTDPMRNPRIESMILALGAVWPTNPNDTSIVEFPDLWRSALERAAAIQQQIFQSLNVNPAMITQQSTASGKKRSQAEIANEQAVDLLTTADVVTIVEEQILTPMIEMFAELDQQFRDDEVTVMTYGELGQEANMERVPPLQLGTRYAYRWYGVENTRSTQAVQQQIGMLNVAKAIPPAMYPDYTLDVAPFMVQMFENAMGPRLARLTFKRKKLISVDPVIENEMLASGFKVPVNPADDDMLHLDAHMMGLQAHGGEDPLGDWRDHIMKHQAQMQQKAMQAQQQAMGSPGAGGGRGPASGSMPQTPTGGKQAPGAIHQDQMGASDPSAMPRKM